MYKLIYESNISKRRKLIYKGHTLFIDKFKWALRGALEGNNLNLLEFIIKLKNEKYNCKYSLFKDYVIK